MVLAFILLAVYFLFYHDDTPMGYGTSQPPSAEVLNTYIADLEAAEKAEHDKVAAENESPGYIDLSPGFVEPETVSTPIWIPPSRTRPSCSMAAQSMR